MQTTNEKRKNALALKLDALFERTEQLKAETNEELKKKLEGKIKRLQEDVYNSELKLKNS